MVGMLISERRGHAASLRARAAADAVTAERLRIARELHDMVAHSIGVIAIQAGVGGRVMQTQPDETRKALQAIETISQATLTGLQQTLGALRETETDVTSPGTAAGLAAVDRLAITTRHAGVRVDVQWRGERRPVPADVDLSAFRIIQEALTNTLRHAPGAHATVRVSCRAGRVVVEVEDTGGVARAGEVSRAVEGMGGGVGLGMGAGRGLIGMRERVALAGGTLLCCGPTVGGFRIEAELPLEHDAVEVAG
jgi:signal transduction histidine kinase